MTMYNYAGSDGKWHPADLERLKEWARQGHVESYAPVIETATGKQTRADAIPDLQPIFAARYEARAKQRAEAATATSAAQTRNRKKGMVWAFGTAIVVLIALPVGRFIWLDKQLPVKLPPATPGAVNAPDLAEAKKFFGTWHCTKQIPAPTEVTELEGKQYNFVTTRLSELVIGSDQRLIVSVKDFTDTSTPDVQGSRTGGQGYTAQWAQQKDAQGGEMWVMRKGVDESPVGAYYRFGPVDKNGNMTTLTLTGAASHNKMRTDEVTGVFTRVPEPQGLQPNQMRKRDIDAQKRRAVK